MTRPLRFAGSMLAAGVAISSLAACGGSSGGSASDTSSSSAPSSSAPSGTSSTSSSGGGDAAAMKIALLLPESQTARYEAFDKPLFEKAIKAACSGCTVLYFNADQDASKQQSQMESALTQGAKVIALDAVDAKAAISLVNSAKSQQVPVIAYDRAIKGADYYVSYQNDVVGKLQGTALVDALHKQGKKSGNLLMVNGDPNDPNAPSFKSGAHSVLDKSGFKIVAEYDTPGWKPANAQSWVDGQLTKVKSGLVGVYSANDGLAGGIISALKGGGVKPLPPVTGQDAELAGIQRIVAGDQAMTIYKAIKPEAEDAAAAAIALGGGKKPNSTKTVDGTPANLLTPVAVTKANIKSTIVKDGFYTTDQICTSDFAAACKRAGLG
jgi:D-xylose transport system substrate-binding protein